MLYIHTTEDAEEALRITKSLDMALALYDITYTTRRRYLKYDETLTDDQYDLLEKVFQEILDCLTENQVNLEDLL